MKKEIFCMFCAKEQRELFPSDEPFPGEFVKFEPGKARREFICDACGRSIMEGTNCVAFSISTKRAPYYPWESHYIKPIKEDDL